MTNEELLAWRVERMEKALLEIFENANAKEVVRVAHEALTYPKLDEDGNRVNLLGMPMMIDPTMKPNEWKLGPPR